MTLATILRSFLYDHAGPQKIDLFGVGLPVDAELAARNEARIAAARERLGANWICAAPINGSAQNSTRAVGARGAAPAREPLQAADAIKSAPDLVTGADVAVLDAGDLHPRLPAWFEAHARDESRDLRRALDYLETADRG